MSKAGAMRCGHEIIMPSRGVSSLARGRAEFHFDEHMSKLIAILRDMARAVLPIIAHDGSGDAESTAISAMSRHEQLQEAPISMSRPARPILPRSVASVIFSKSS